MQTDKVKGQVYVALLSFDLKNKTRWTLFTRGNWAYEQEMLNLRLLGWKQFNNVNVCVFLPRWWISLNFHSITAKLPSTWSHSWCWNTKQFLSNKKLANKLLIRPIFSATDLPLLVCCCQLLRLWLLLLVCSSADLDRPWGVEWGMDLGIFTKQQILKILIK